MELASQTSSWTCLQGPGSHAWLHFTDQLLALFRTVAPRRIPQAEALRPSVRHLRSCRYIHCEKSIAADPIGDLFGRVEKQALGFPLVGMVSCDGTPG